jgi:DNA-binding NarL/FixJ family response regulator
MRARMMAQAQPITRPARPAQEQAAPPARLAHRSHPAVRRPERAAAERRDAVITVLVCDRALARGTIAALLDAEGDIRVVGQAADAAELLRECVRRQPDVVVTEVDLPDSDGLEAASRLRTLPKPPRVVLLTASDVDARVFGALRAGAAGFLGKDVEPAELVSAVRTVAAGGAVLEPRALRRVLDAFADRLPGGDPAAAAALGRLTPRELQVLKLVAQGRTNGQIGRELKVGETTVKTHVSRTLTKLRCRSRVQAVILAREVGLV